MRWLALVVVLCACDRVLGLAHAIPADAADSHGPFYDAHLATGCPQSGTTPVFSPQLVQVVEQPCFQYYPRSPVRDLAIGWCYDVNGQEFLGAGPIDSPLAPAVGLDALESTATLQTIDFGADGVVYAMYLSTSPSEFEYRTYHQQPDGSWARGTDLLRPTPGTMIVPAPSTTTPRHLISYANADTVLHELVGDVGAWVDTGNPTPLAALGLSTIFWAHLSADGLRLTLTGLLTSSGRSHTVYTDRATLADSFRPVTTMPGIPDQTYATLSEDCTRAYVTGLDSVFYVEEIVPPM